MTYPTTPEQLCKEPLFVDYVRAAVVPHWYPDAETEIQWSANRFFEVYASSVRRDDDFMDDKTLPEIAQSVYDYCVKAGVEFMSCEPRTENSTNPKKLGFVPVKVWTPPRQERVILRSPTARTCVEIAASLEAFSKDTHWYVREAAKNNLVFRQNA